MTGKPQQKENMKTINDMTVEPNEELTIGEFLDKYGEDPKYFEAIQKLLKEQYPLFFEAEPIEELIEYVILKLKSVERQTDLLTGSEFYSAIYTGEFNGFVNLPKIQDRYLLHKGTINEDGTWTVEYITEFELQYGDVTTEIKIGVIK